MFYSIINKVPLTHQGQGHLKVKVKFMEIVSENSTNFVK